LMKDAAEISADIFRFFSCPFANVFIGDGPLWSQFGPSVIKKALHGAD
jgi:hypothetical protein